MKIKWDLFKVSGKWKYEGISNIPDGAELWDDNVLDLIDENQNDVSKGIISRRCYYLVVDLIEDSCKDSGKFFKAMFPAIL